MEDAGRRRERHGKTVGAFRTGLPGRRLLQVYRVKNEGCERMTPSYGIWRREAAAF